MPKIQIPLMGFNASGGLRIITQLANCLSQDGWQVEILVPDFAATPHFELDAQISIRALNTFGLSRRLQIISYLIHLIFKACIGTHVCLATYYLTPVPIWLAWLLNFRRAKLVYLMQQYHPPNPKKIGSMTFTLYAHLGYRLPFHKIAVSDWIKNQMADEQITVIPNGVDRRQFYPSPQPRPKDHVILGGVGRLGSTKGFDQLIQALSPFAERDHIQVEILSDQAINLPPNMRHIIPQHDQDIRAFYGRCDIFVFTSILEGFGLPPLEAMACGAAVITTDCGGVLTFATPQNSIIVPVNDVAALQKSIESLIKDTNLREGLQQEGLQTAKQFSSAKMCGAYRAYFKKL